jgi:hypothetical protein
MTFGFVIITLQEKSYKYKYLSFSFFIRLKKEIMDTVKDAVNTLLGRKPDGPKVRYGVVGAGWISQAAFMPGVGQTSNSGI